MRDEEAAVLEAGHGARVERGERDLLLDGALLRVDDGDGLLAGEGHRHPAVAELGEADGLDAHLDGADELAGLDVDDVEAVAVARGDDGEVTVDHEVRRAVGHVDAMEHLARLAVEHEDLIVVLGGDDEEAVVGGEAERAGRRRGPGTDAVAFGLTAERRQHPDEGEGQGPLPQDSPSHASSLLRA